MQCELSTEELRDLYMAVLDRLITARIAMREGRGGMKLRENIEKYEALRRKVLELLGETDAKDYS